MKTYTHMYKVKASLMSCFNTDVSSRGCHLAVGASSTGDRLCM